MIELFRNRFIDLEKQLVNIGETKKSVPSSLYGSRDIVNEELLDEWRVKAKNIISKACGIDSEHYKEFIIAEKFQGSFDSSFEMFKRVKSVFNAAKEDYLGGYVETIEKIIHAEVFDSQIDQAKELLKNGYYNAAAVIAGVILETNLKKLCISNKIDIGKLDKMNTELCRRRVYDIFIQKRITAIADLRNKAAHGELPKILEKDVDIMIKDVEHLLANHLLY